MALLAQFFVDCVLPNLLFCWDPSSTILLYTMSFILENNLSSWLNISIAFVGLSLAYMQSPPYQSFGYAERTLFRDLLSAGSDPGSACLRRVRPLLRNQFRECAFSTEVMKTSARLPPVVLCLNSSCHVVQTRYYSTSISV